MHTEPTTFLEDLQRTDVLEDKDLESLHRIVALEATVAALTFEAVVQPSKHFSTHDFYLKTKIVNRLKQWSELNKWIEVITTLRGIGKFKVKHVFRALGYRDFVALVGKEMRGHPQRRIPDRDIQIRFECIVTKNAFL